MAQLAITFPTERMVLQRDPQKPVQIPVSGFAFLPFDRVEARLVALDGSLPVSEEWSLLEARPQHGSFSGSLAAQGGWYRLEVRGIFQEKPVDTVRVNRVGVGEVFLISGNSNAMGLPNLGAKGASDQVVSFNALNKSLNKEFITVAPNEPFPKPVFTPLSATNNVFPAGETPWYWGELGDMLSKRLGVPILFLNASWAAANSENWRETAEGRDTRNIYVGKNWPNRQPYSNLINTLRYINSSVGVRSILWSHGENDAAHLKISQARYYDNMRFLIQRSRQDFGQNVPWVIALASVSINLPSPYLPVVNAQKQLGNDRGFNLWPGPDTDLIQVPRPEHGHFENVNRGTQGLTEAAQAWNNSLTDEFFQKSVPVLPRGFVHTGVVPAAAPPGSRFQISYRVGSNLSAGSQVQAELLNETGAYVATVGAGSGSPLMVTLPGNLAAGQYHIRVVVQQPRLVGSLSEPLVVNPELKSPQFIRKFIAYPTEYEVTLYWLMAIDTERRSMTVQKSLDRENYEDVGPVNPGPDTRNPQFYSYVDPNPDEGTAFYRIRTEHWNGSVHFSPSVAVFRGDAPPPFTVFPNPAERGPVFLRTDNAEQFELQLVDQQGRVVPTHVRPSEVIGLSIMEPATFINPGLYTLVVVHEAKRYSQPILFH